MKPKIMKSAVIVMAVIAVAMAVLGVRQVFFHVDTDFDSTVVIGGLIALFAGFAAVQIFCLLLEPFRLKKIGFFLLHIGLVAVLFGSLLYYLVGIKIAGVYPVNEYGSSADAGFTLMKGNLFKGEDYAGNVTSFNLGVTDFRVDYYDPVYDVYADRGETLLLSDVEAKDGVYDFGEYGSLTVKDSIDITGNAQTVPLGDERYAVPRVTEKYFEASVVVYNREENTNTEEVLIVNHPIRVNGWKIYLQSHGAGVVQLVLKYDPGEYIVLIGMWMLVFGTILSCFVRRKEGTA